MMIDAQSCGLPLSRTRWLSISRHASQGAVNESAFRQTLKEQISIMARIPVCMKDCILKSGQMKMLKLDQTLMDELEEPSYHQNLILDTSVQTIGVAKSSKSYYIVDLG